MTTRPAPTSALRSLQAVAELAVQPEARRAVDGLSHERGREAACARGARSLWRTSSVNKINSRCMSLRKRRVHRAEAAMRTGSGKHGHIGKIVIDAALCSSQRLDLEQTMQLFAHASKEDASKETAHGCQSAELDTAVEKRMLPRHAGAVKREFTHRASVAHAATTLCAAKYPRLDTNPA